MIISKITDGLGNQMFQYAAGRAIAEERGDSWRLDISGFANDERRHYFDLERIFNCRPEIAGETDVRVILGWQSSSLIRRLLSRKSMKAFRRENFVVEPHFHYWPEINHVPQDCYLAGYWQSEKYFQTHASLVRADLTFKPPLTDRNAELAEQIARVNAVSLHIRRGDYAGNHRMLSKHGVCPLSYYQEAIRYIAGRVSAPHYFVFSDDMDWVRANLTFHNPCCYVAHNRDSESYNDMRLMSLCRHHIIANSSFSWWGAWLNPSTTKIVIAPKRWFNEYPADTGDLFPEGWVTL